MVAMFARSATFAFLVAPALFSQDALRTVTLSDLTWSTERSPNLERRLVGWEFRRNALPEARSDAAETWLGLPYVENWNDQNAPRLGDVELTLVGDPGQTITGEVWFRGPHHNLVPFPFVVHIEGEGDGDQVSLLKNRYLSYSWRHALDLPGAAWFRYQKGVAARELEALGLGLPRFPSDAIRNEMGRKHSFDDTFDLFTGGRALAENLALEDAVEVTADQGPTVPIATIAGITVPPIEWGPLVAGIDPQLDPLAARIPEDQHAIFIPSFGSLVQVLDELRRSGAPVLELLDHSSEDAGTQARYEAQLALPLDASARILGGALVRSVAITGGDPYFRTGTDVAVLFETTNARALTAAILARQQEEARAYPDAAAVDGTIDGLAYEGMQTPDRRLSSLVARIGDDVIVTNSTSQLRRLQEVAKGSVVPLVKLDEYRWFRDRYLRGGDEDALVVVSDATIRRWASPQWRIGASRRVRAAAWMADQSAGHLAMALDRGNLDRVPAVRSELYGTPDFLTPIGELNLDLVTEEEVQGYARFRTRYTNLWREVFDPVALSLKVEGNALSLDLTVRPIAVRSGYRDWIELTAGATLAPTAGDPHDGTALHFAFALGRDSDMFRFLKGFLSNGPMKDVADPLSWLGHDVAVWLEDDPELWQEALGHDEPSAFLLDNIFRMPIAARLPSNDPLKLAVFLTGLRSYIEGAAPDLVHYEARRHAGRGYVAILSGDLEDVVGQPLAVYYVGLPNAWVLSFREDVIQSVIDRYESPPEDSVAPNWLGESAALRLGPGFRPALAAMFGDEWRSERQRLSWRSLPILEEWRRLAPGTDPVAFHAEHFGVHLRGPDGGRYVVDGESGLLTCSVFGNPSKPVEGPYLPPALNAFKGVEFGIGFEEGDGLRARARITR